MLYANGYPVGGGGGGSDTGGHTIIDENGNSMPARAGLQFVGGVNVSDDATNNKTIVDISGSGGGFGLVQSGHTVYTLTGQNLEDRVSITFDTPFPEVPNVAVSLSDPSRGQYYNPQTGLGVMNVTENGFDILIKSSSQAVAGDIVIYWIATTKFSGNGIFYPTIYSLEEREVGVWTDGKPLYEKTLELSSIPSTSPISIDVSALNIDVMASAIGEVYAISNGVIVEAMVLPTYISQSYYGAIRFLNDNVQILHTGLGDYSSGKIVIQYTKTTDVAGSGTWTPQGVPAVHYTTDEQVIGTYLGDTFCRKTIHNVSITSGVQWIDTGIDSSCKIIETKGVLFKSGGDIVTMSCADSGGSVNDLSVAGINTCSVGIITAGKWSVLFRTLKSDMRGDLDLTVYYTKSS